MAFRFTLIGELGQAVDSLPSITINKVKSIESALASEESRKEWRERLAEEILLSKALDLALDKRLLKHFAEVCPFRDHTPTLGTLLRYSSACTVIPLDTSGQHGIGPALAHLWFFAMPQTVKSSDHRTKWEGMDSFLNNKKNVGIFSIASHLSTDKYLGPSWQFGTEIAIRALIKKNIPVLRELAANWIISGKVISGGKTDRIALGNKLDLFTPHRCWLFPEKNRKDLSPRFRIREDFRCAISVNSAWSIITGKGVKEGETKPWPKNLDEVHTFVSGAREPALAAILISCPERVVLWHTDNKNVSEDRADDITNIIINLLPGTFVEKKEISSRSMFEADQVLRKELEPSLRAGKTVLFNVTQGNRLMSYAVHSIAYTSPDLWLVYRDIDEQPFRFTLISYESGIPLTRFLDGDKDTLNINWETLFFKPTFRAPEPWQELLEKIQHKSE